MQKEKALLEICLSPALLDLYDLKDTIVVVIDIFRATTTMSVAMANGAASIYPFKKVEECLAFKKQKPDVISAGERNGIIVEGMDKGNSPAEFSVDIINDKSLALTTTNGTKILHMSMAAEEIVIGSFVNIDNVVAYLKKKNQKVLLACAGWKDKVNMEDSLFAGAVASALKNDFHIQCDSSKMCMDLWSLTDKGNRLYEVLKGSSHYNRLSGFGAHKDLVICTSLNTHPCLPVYQDGKIINILK